MIGFHEIRFPEDVSWGSSGGPVYKTQVFTSHRGYEKRNIDWSQPMMEFNVAYGVRRDEQIERVIAFFNARQGKLFGFRYKNWCNYAIKNGPIAVGDGESRRLPLYKFYGFVGSRHYKRLYKIVRGSVSGVIAGSEPVVEGTDFQIDYDSGEIVFNDPLGYGVTVTAVNLEFDEPVRFDEDNIENVIEAYNNNSLNTLTLVGVRGTFTEGSVFSPNLVEYGQYDPDFNSVTLLLNFDGQQVSSTYDQSNLHNAVTFVGTAAVDTAVYRHGGGSLALRATGRLDVDGAGQDLSTNPFTIEVFAQRPRTGELYQPIVARWAATSLEKSYLLRYNMLRQRIELLVSEDGTGDRIVLSHPWEFNFDYFDYLRVDRTASGWWVLRINGDAKNVVKDVDPVYAGTADCTIGAVSEPPADYGPFQGHIDSIRITSGVARSVTADKVDIPTPNARAGLR